MSDPRTDGSGYHRVRRVVGAIRWYVRGVLGADAYERYAAHQSARHPDLPLLDERSFWRAKYADMDRHPQSRCC
jgi:uncharacterized short protein YbdD (DUF466 family)